MGGGGQPVATAQPKQKKEEMWIYVHASSMILTHNLTDQEKAFHALVCTELI
jgi:hypothetical protein